MSWLFLSPPPCQTLEGVVLWSLLGQCVAGKLTKGRETPPPLTGLLEFLTLTLVHMEPLTAHWFQLRLSLPRAGSHRGVCLGVSLCVPIGPAGSEGRGVPRDLTCLMGLRRAADFGLVWMSPVVRTEQQLLSSSWAPEVCLVVRCIHDV